MRIVQVAAEFAPLAKAGGLGEVIVGLSRELTHLHEEVEIIAPKHDLIPSHFLRSVHMEIPDFKSIENGKLYSNAMWSLEAEGCRLHLLDPRHPAGYFHRGKIYGCNDDVPRYLYFCRAVAEYLKLKQKPIDILHLHDWHTAALAPLIRDLFQGEIEVKAIVLSIHNAEYQGKCAIPDLNAIGLPGETYLTADKLQDNNPKYPQTINLLKGGIVYSDSVIAVSPTYAKEILTPEFNPGLYKTLQKYESKVSGILNGVDLQLWNPATDPHLATHYNASDSRAKISTAKDAMKKALISRFELDAKARPWFGAVTRIVEQKSPDLLISALEFALKQKAMFLLLGSSPNPDLQRQFEELKSKYAENNRVLLHLEYDDALAHQIYAALDFLLVPSRYEPCGLTQMIGLHYGTLPIAYATGGLIDTIVDCDNPLAPSEQRNGFVFQELTPTSLHEAMQRAIQLKKTNPATFQNLIRRGMELDFSWQKPTQEYLKRFRSLLRRKDSLAI